MNTIIVNGYGNRLESCLESLCGVGGVKRESVTVVSSPQGRDASGIAPHPHWRDTKNPKLLSWGELGCAAGHIKAWRIVADQSEAMLIVEDDVRATGELRLDRWRSHLNEGHAWVAYLGYKCMAGWPDDVAVHTEDGLHFRVAPRCWWACGYIVTPTAARRLLHAVAVMGQRIIPVDELLPLVCGKGVTEDRLGLITPTEMEGTVKSYCALPQAIEPSGAESTTDTHDRAFGLHVVTFATEREKAQRLVDSLEKHGHAYTVLGDGKDGWDTGVEGGRQKLEWFVEWAQSRIKRMTKGGEVVLMLDGYDTIVTETPQIILARYEQMRYPIVVSGERNPWPSSSKNDALNLEGSLANIDAYPEEDVVAYPYPCSGGIIGDIETLQAQITDGLVRFSDESDDQRLVQRLVLQSPSHWRIDREAYLFQSLAGDDAFGADGYNEKTETWPCIIHANGPDAELPEIRRQPSQFDGAGSAPLGDSPMEVADGVVRVRVFSAEEAHRLAAVLDGLLGWGALDDDDVPGDELRLAAVAEPLAASGFGTVAQRIEEALRPAANARWFPPASWTGIRDLFATRYSPMGRCSSIDLHNDISRFSASIVLRRAHRGGELWLPRQNFTDRLIEPGVALFWPSRVTHPHQVMEVESGQRISLVVWTEED